MTEDANQYYQHNAETISHHVFMYPFRWDFLPKHKNYNDYNFDDRTDIQQWDKFLDSSLWEKQDFNIGEREIHKDFNEFMFFYDHVKKTLYNYPNVEETENRMLFYNYQFDNTKASYTIKIQGDDRFPNGSNYKLSIADINLHIFDTGIGILTFNLNNYERRTTEDDILRINDSGRRIYPQFLGANLVADTKKAFLADSIEVDPANGKGPFFENFCSFFDKEQIERKYNIKLPSFIAELFGNSDITANRNNNNDSIIIKNIMDDRMFTICWYGNKDLSQKLRSENEQHPYKNSPWWYCFIFGDRNQNFPCCQNNEELIKYIGQHSYTRWTGVGTFYGATAETLVCLAEEKKNAKGPPVWDHMTTIYYQMCILCLLQQASILRFSGEAAILGGKLKNKSISNISEFSNLYNNYIEFINKFLFKKITAQIQGAEIYNLLQRFMNIDEAATDLRNDMQELHNYMNIEQQNRVSADSYRLSLLAAIFLPASIILSIFGLTHFPKLDFTNGVFWIWDVALPILLSLAAIILTLYFLKIFRFKFKK